MKRIVNVLVLLMCIGLLTGCNFGEKDKYEKKVKQDVAIILANRSNMPVLDLSSIDNDIKPIAEFGGNISFIVSDGKPFEKHMAIEAIDDGLSSSKRDSILEERINTIHTYAKSLQAKTKEADVLGALQLASRVLNSLDDSNEKKIILMDNLIQTVRPLNFSESSLENLNVKNTIDKLQKENNIPKLENIDIDIYYCGDSILNQQPLTEKNKECLKNIWNEIFKAANVESCKFKSNLPITDNFSISSLPSVSPVKILQEEDVINSKNFENSYISYDESKIAFVSGKAELISKKDALSTLQSVAKYLKLSGEKVSLIGCTAKWGEYNDCLKLSEDRAKVIQMLLEELGVNKNCIETIGTGYDSPFYENDHDQNNELIKSIAQKNRTVILLSSQNNIVKSLKNKFSH